MKSKKYKRHVSNYIEKQPEKRRLKIYASDPIDGRRRKYRISIAIKNEGDIKEGPSGTIVEVIDYDGYHDQYYQSVDLNDDGILMNDGVEPNESDPRFHQQMVYAVAMKVIETAGNAIGQPIAFQTEDHPKLRLIPHAFYGANAFFSPRLNAILFGYFKADEESPGSNIPGQNVFTCLSHDIIAHEVAHAIVHRLRPDYMEPTNPDVLAFHEGFADIVALFQRFSYQDILRDHISSSRTELKNASMMVDLANQFGQATGTGKALRSAIGDPNATLDSTSEPHLRGAILVSAIFDGFFATYKRRIEDLIRLSSGGSGLLQDGNLPVDLVNRVASEASLAARSVLTMCFRAFDYLPPVDVTLGDFLRAIVTADFDVNPEDEFDLRHSVIEGFRKRAIMPDNVVSLAEESLILEGIRISNLEEPEQGSEETREETREEKIDRLKLKDELLGELKESLNQALLARDKTAKLETKREKRFKDYRERTDQRAFNYKSNRIDDADNVQNLTKVFELAKKHLTNHRNDFGLSNQHDVEIRSISPRVVSGSDGSILTQYVITAIQEDKKMGYKGTPLKGGVTIVANADGTIRYVIPKPLPTTQDELEEEQTLAAKRVKSIRDFQLSIENKHSKATWFGFPSEKPNFKISDFRLIHGGYQ